LLLRTARQPRVALVRSNEMLVRDLIGGKVRDLLAGL